MLIKFSVAVFALVSSVSLNGVGEEKDIVDTAVAADDFNTLVTAVQAAGLVETLKGEGPFTVFAPSDRAFAELPAEELEAILADTAKLTAVLLYHIVPGRIMSAELNGLDSAITLEGSDLAVTVADAGLRIGNANVIQTDIETSNGVLHVIDRVNLPTPRSVRASGLFAGPGQFPPRHFRAYGILAFSSTVNDGNRSRYEAICRGYISALPAARNLLRRGVNIQDQMVTVWPLKEADFADSLNQNPPSLEKCDDIVVSIDRITSREAMADARSADQNVDLSRAGPYLIAWSPATQKGEPDVPVLIADLSDITNVIQATSIFRDWAEQIEGDPELWSSGWSLERLRVRLRLWADKYGTLILRPYGLGED